MLNWLKAKTGIAKGLSFGDWLALGEAWLALLWFYFAIRVTSFEQLNSRKTKTISSTTEGLAIAHNLQRLIHLASRLHLLRMTCLPRAFALRRLLVRRRIPAAVQIGVTKGPQGSIHAHAWLEVNGQQVGEREDVTERFRAFDFTKG